ncbi:MAG: M3 family metallopeptidase, partial [Lysobacterales bacterium]
MSGGNGDACDNKSIIREIVRLRAERAKLLGFPSHAHWAVADQMAATPETAKALLMRVWEPAVARAREEIADMQALANEEGADFEIARWDRLYYSEKLRRARFQVDQAGVRQYLQMEKLREAMFWAAGELYQLDFAPAHHVPVYHPDVCVFEVSRSGQAVGLCWFDPFARPGKREGAWMTEYRTQENFRETILPMVSNNTNFIPGETGEPVLVSWEDAGAMFHEFGHALHGLSSNVSYPSLAGVQVARDLIELPSQINERWLSTAEVLTRFAIHHKTGEPMPAELINRIEKARNFDQGETVEYLAAAIYDLKIHMAEGDEAIDPVAMEQQVLTEIDIPPAMGMRHRPTHFSHIFSGSYAAGYYVYLWADVLAADVAEVFVRSPGGFYDHTTAERLLGKVL